MIAVEQISPLEQPEIHWRKSFFELLLGWMLLAGQSFAKWSYANRLAPQIGQGFIKKVSMIVSRISKTAAVVA